MTYSTLTRVAARLTLLVTGAALIASCGGTPTPDESGSDTTATAEASGDACAPEIAEIDFGIISTESQTNLEELWEPFLALMSEEMGRPVNSFYATDYAGVIEAMGAGKIQIAWYGGKSYIEAAKRSGAEAFAQTVDSDGSKGYYAHLVTNVDNPIVSEIDLEAGDGDRYVIENAAELTFAFNDPNSTSGFLVPSYYVFAQNGVNPNEAFSELIFAGSHEATAQAVANNQVDVATNNSESMSRLQKTDAEAFEQVQIIWTSPLIPSDPIAYKSDLPDCLKEEFQDFFYNISDESVLGPLDWSRFDEAGDEDWNPIRELDIARKIEEIKNDGALSEDDKTAKIKELGKQLEELQ
ncbi:phosphonate ABC transporter, periplasmic phosphonate binding protein [Rubidibacter lacunae KORDI 51-2]|uniref:Phosphonate ABC transporter, periplasmic phosphonate binding protein n=1 Tax=Rubidibacter lacunae KORDI 51-2 TaxID=582515 RepID=U5DMK3_9CHRO|nr:phosphonate ABC transporter substrate-binding protein [Rubidibacter lacunae]ERN42906.1 phosphonate ABC transporter, periplasmic phosphonate binding protein [Rubidibacter lacunae KORDI 51-2]